MKRHLQFFLLCISLLATSLVACHSQKFTADNLPEKQLRFGSGGGFTGQTTTYTLLENGQVFSTNSLKKETKEVAKISKKIARQLFAQAEALKLGERNLHQPGNMSYFLQLKQGSSEAKVTWGSPSQPAPQDLLDFYQQLQKQTIR